MTADAIRAEAAEVAQVCAQAARLGVTIDAADAVTKGVKPEALRAKVLADLAARSDAAGIIATAPAAARQGKPDHRGREEVATDAQALIPAPITARQRHLPHPPTSWRLTNARPDGTAQHGRCPQI
jgi:hypothetical protein